MNKIITHYLDSEINDSDSEILNLEARISEFEKKPGGRLLKGSSHGKTQYHIIIDGVRAYLPKTEFSKLQPYLQNYHDRHILKKLKAWNKACKNFQKAVIDYDNIYSNFDPYIRNNVISLDLDFDYQIFENEGLRVLAPNRDFKFKTMRGDYVRSKSEAIIANIFYVCGLHYRYEDEFIINGVSYYPDFMIMHPLTKDIYMWEHFGLIDKQKYYEKMCEKLNVYALAGYCLGKNMIATFESDDIPLQIEMVERYVEKFFGVSINATGNASNG